MNKPDVLSQIRNIIEREYAAPSIISGKCWEERATAGIAELLEPLIQQVRVERSRRHQSWLANVSGWRKPKRIKELIQQAKEEVAREIFEEIEPFIIEALQAPTHEANDYNCEDWPPGTGCSGCKGDKVREKAVQKLAEAKYKFLKDKSL